MTLEALVEHHHVVVCCGTGGVGKTTTSAVLALAAARRGRNAIVVTIDPAKRLADTLGLESLGNVAHEIDRGLWDPTGDEHAGLIGRRRDAPSPPASVGTAGDAGLTGRLSALMLDTRSTFDALVNKHAKSPEQAERILDNRFYRNIAGVLSGTQEYMAMEKLHELHEEGGYDLIVIDTPPTRHALDFLEAPARLTRLLDNRIFRVLMVPTRIAGVAVAAFLRTVAKVVGTEVIDDIVAFFRAFEGMEQGFRERAASVTELLADDQTAFVLVTSPRRDAVEEAEFFADRLHEGDLDVAALIVNRVHPDFGESSDAPAVRERANAIARLIPAAATTPARNATARLAARYANLADYASLGRREREQLAGVGERIRAESVAYVPSLADDIVDFAALDAVADHLLGNYVVSDG